RIESAARMRPGFDVIEGDLRAVVGHVRVPEAEPLAEPAAGANAVGANSIDLARIRERRFAVIADGLDALARRNPLCVVLREEVDAEAFASFVAGAEPSGRLLILVPARAPLARPFAEVIALAPLAPEAVAELVCRAVGSEAPAAGVE